LPPQRVGGHVVHPEIPVQMKDRLAETGRALEPVVAELAAWAERQGDPAPVASVRS
jgi:DNA-binding HxlR family transcriptional regulator